jgi:hypothetical protein
MNAQITTSSQSTPASAEYAVLPISGCLPNRDRSCLNVKPREDAHVVDRFNRIYIVADGVTRTPANNLYPIPSPAALAAEVFTQEAHKAICSVMHSLPPKEVLLFGARMGNQAVWRLNQTIYADQDVDFDTRDLGCACAILTLMHGGQLHYLFNGDCVGYTEDSEGSRVRFTPSQTARLEAWKASADPTERAYPFVRKNIRNNVNHPGRYGVFTGETAALDPRLLDFGTIDLNKVSRVILTSDGLDELFQSGEPIDPGLPLTLLRSAETLESATGSRSDDKTIVTLEIFGPI